MIPDYRARRGKLKPPSVLGMTARRAQGSCFLKPRAGALTLSRRVDYFGASLDDSRAIITTILLMVAVWAFSTAVAYRNYIVPAFRAWQREPHNAAAIARRNEFMERFDRGVVLEHIAFPLVLAGGG